MLHVELKVVGGKHNNQVLVLPTGKFLIGREQDCHLRPNSELVSRHHCVFTTDEYGCRVRDLGSTNGTFVNGLRITKPVELTAGDRVAVGALNFEVVVRKPAPVPVASGPDAAAPDTAPDAVPDQPPTRNPALDNTESGSETIMNMPAIPDVGPEAAAGDTTMISTPPPPPATTPEQAAQPPAPYAPPPMQYPPGYNQPMYQPQPMYPPGYPGMAYPPQMPPQPYPPQPYPPQPYPPQGYPPQPVPPQQQAPPAPPEAVEEDRTPDVALPDPSDTGIKPDQEVKGSGGANKDADNPSGNAGDIIKQYIQRRPTK